MMNMIHLQKMPSKVEPAFVPSGDKKRPLFKYEYDVNYGCPRRVLNGFMDCLDFVQQSADDVDFASIGKMLIDSKDNIIGHFKTDHDEVVDIVGMPRNIHEYNAMQNNLREKFDSMDPEIRGLFGNDLDMFRQAYLNGSIQGIFDNYSKSKEGISDVSTDGKDGK